MNKKVRVATLSVLSNSLLIIMKVSVGMISGSVSILSEAIHSSIDLIAAIIAFFSVRVSAIEPDERHPYGHGKFENLSGVIEGFLIFVAAGWIIFEAVKKITGAEPVDNIGWGSLVMFVSGVVNILVSRRLYKVAKETDSVALEADALHLKTDVITSFGVAAALFLMHFTHFYILDPVIAILVALFILRESYLLMRRAFSPLLDVSLSKEELSEIEDILKKMNVRYHDLKSRKAGNFKFIDFHLDLPPDLTLDRVHEYCDEIEDNLKQEINYLSVNIHAEPNQLIK